MSKRVVDPFVADRTAELINAAAQLIEERGHAHKEYEDTQGRLCILGALAEVSDMAAVPVPTAVAGEAVRALHRGLKRDYNVATTLSFWNDSNDQETVLSLMRRTVQRYRSGDFE
jgi:hypothetical protein